MVVSSLQVIEYVYKDEILHFGSHDFTTEVVVAGMVEWNEWNE
jgi:hypothetical protein